MMGSGPLEPRLTGPIDANRLVIDLAPDLAREDVGVDESRAGVTVRDRACPWGVVDDEGDQALPRQVRDRLVCGDGYGFAESRAVGAVAPSARLISACCVRAASSAKPPPTISTVNVIIRIVFI